MTTPNNGGAAKPLLVRKGRYYKDDAGTFRVMAVAEGYAMCRRPHAMPFVRSMKVISNTCERVAPGAES